jgi:hypothetical protein
MDGDRWMDECILDLCLDTLEDTDDHLYPTELLFSESARDAAHLCGCSMRR